MNRERFLEEIPRPEAIIALVDGQTRYPWPKSAAERDAMFRRQGLHPEATRCGTGVPRGQPNPRSVHRLGSHRYRLLASCCPNRIAARRTGS